MLAIDGERVENPFDRRTPPRPGVHRIEARMPGYQNATQTVTLEADRTVALRLAPLGAPPPPTPRVQPTPQPQTPPTQTPRAPRPPRQPRPRAGAGFVSDNPYE